MILALVEHKAGEVDASSLEAVTFARRLAEGLGAPLSAVAVGPGADGVGAQLGEHGVTVVHAARYAGDDAYAPRAWARAVVTLIGAGGDGAGAIQAVVAPATERGNEVLAYVGALSDLPTVTNCIDTTPGEAFRLSRLRWAGSIVEDAVLDVAGPKLLTVATDTVAAEAAPSGGEIVLRHLEVALEDRDLAVRVDEVLESTAEGVALADARVVVGGGRGVGGEEGFAVLDELAGLLGGAVGVSRVVTSLGWRPHKDQIGQTGCRIAPELYIACGISGAIQHMAGCKGARNIMAINSDPDASIMTKADYAVVGDLHAVLPAIVAEVRQALGRS